MAATKKETRATTRASYLDEYVEATVLNALQDTGSVLATALESNEAAEAAARDVEAAAHELELYLQTDLMTVVGPDASAQASNHASNESMTHARTSPSSRPPRSSATTSSPATS